MLMQRINNKSCKLLEQYLGYLTVMKGRSENTVTEYRGDLVMFFKFIKESRNPKDTSYERMDFSDIDIEYIKSITVNDMYAYITNCQRERKISASTRARRIVSIRQFWKYLKTKAHLIENNIAEEMETPKIPKRIPKYLSLEDSMRLLINSENSIRNHCILTVFLNCALRLSELTNIDVSQINGDTLAVIGNLNTAYYHPFSRPRQGSKYCHTFLDTLSLLPVYRGKQHRDGYIAAKRSDYSYAYS